mgnify:FL=1|jgi:serine/threonine protein kinase
MLTCQRYDEHVDIWSTGCIFAEMLQGKPLFPGRDHIDQFRVTTEVLGTPSENVIAKITAQNVSMVKACGAAPTMSPQNVQLKEDSSTSPADLWLHGRR